jgi:predicted N-acetyltransferase YhbS
MNIILRREKASDFHAVYRVHQAAFRQEAEGRLLEKLRKNKAYIPDLSLVAMKDSDIVGFYPRFGFVPASRWGIESPFEVPDEAFMAAELVPGGLDGISGKVKFNDAFEELQYRFHFTPQVAFQASSGNFV